jgi:hypothetical protein
MFIELAGVARTVGNTNWYEQLIQKLWTFMTRIVKELD